MKPSLWRLSSAGQLIPSKTSIATCIEQHNVAHILIAILNGLRSISENSFECNREDNG